MSGPVPVTRIEERGAAHGFSKKQLIYAKQHLGIVVFKEVGRRNVSRRSGQHLGRLVHRAHEVTSLTSLLVRQEDAQDAQDARGSILALPRLAARSGPLRPWSARSRLVEHSNPAHANPTAQVPAARRDDRPATRRRTTGRKHRFIDRIRAPHNRCIATPINARNGRPEELDRGLCAAAGITRRSGGGPTPARPIGETADQRLRAPKGRRCTMHNQTPITYTTIQNLYLFFICSCYTISIQARVIVCIVQAKG